MESGRTLLQRISYEGLSVSELCKEANLTTGAFYRRFESKDAFFLALQRLALDDAARVKQTLDSRLDSKADAPVALMECAWVVVEAIRAWHLSHRGVIRASIQRRDHTPGSWEPFREFGRGFVEDFAPRVARFPELCGRSDALPRLQIAFQIVIGTMVNAALNDPGPLKLDAPAMTDALAQMFTLYVGAGAGGGANRESEVDVRP
ncbi:TetR/AcrR family transcriptional regulator [Paraburkholderia solitsugae]|uniref:TetR/AcrR family transcriptional regulator n=1 Tax=Paraburkholderia solitsugae TaxID=2675748 RepID=UPI0022A8AEAC|nr:TetR/AcrR family transcriptional regulator [Paraburkholderia solitsugae]